MKIQSLKPPTNTVNILTLARSSSSAAAAATGGNSSFSAAPFQTKLSDGDGVRKGGLLPRKELRRRRRAKTVEAVSLAVI